MTGSNRRHPRCKRGALPTELIAHVVIISEYTLAIKYTNKTNYQKYNAGHVTAAGIQIHYHEP